MTAGVLAFPADSVARTDDTIRRTIKALITGRELRVEDVAPAVGMTPATFYRRLAGKGRQQAFGAGEVAALAAYFRVEVSDLYGGLGGRFTPPNGGGAVTAGSRTGTAPVTAGKFEQRNAPQPPLSPALAPAA